MMIWARTGCHLNKLYGQVLEVLALEGPDAKIPEASSLEDETMPDAAGLEQAKESILAFRVGQKINIYAVQPRRRRDRGTT